MVLELAASWQQVMDCLVIKNSVLHGMEQGRKWQARPGLSNFPTTNVASYTCFSCGVTHFENSSLNASPSWITQFYITLESNAVWGFLARIHQNHGKFGCWEILWRSFLTTLVFSIPWPLALFAEEISRKAWGKAFNHSRSSQVIRGCNFPYSTLRNSAFLQENCSGK